MTDNSKIKKLIIEQVRELNQRIDSNLNIYISEVAHSRAIRSNLVKNIHDDANSINEFIETFQLKGVSRHYIAEALANDPGQDVLSILSRRCDNILDDDTVINIPTQSTDNEDEMVVYTTETNQTFEVNAAEEIPTDETLDNSCGLESSEQNAVEDEPVQKPKKRKRTYSLIIDECIDDGEDAKYKIKTTIYVTPKGEILDDSAESANAFTL